MDFSKTMLSIFLNSPFHSNYISILILNDKISEQRYNNNPPDKTSYGNNFNFKKLLFSLTQVFTLDDF